MVTWLRWEREREALCGKTKVADYQQHNRYTAGPIAADGKVFAGLACRVGSLKSCFMTAHDAATGKQLWRRESIAGPGDPEEHNATWGWCAL